MLTTARRDAEPDGCKHFGQGSVECAASTIQVAGFLIFRREHVAYARRDLSSVGPLLSVELACPDVTRWADATSLSDADVLE